MKLRIALTTLLLLASSLPAAAEATPAAEKWLDKLQTLVESGAYRMDYTMELGGVANGTPVSATATGDYLQGGPRLSVNQFEMKASMAPGTDQVMEVSSRQISDGTTLWAETNLVSMGMTQVGKIDLDALEEFQAEQTGLEVNQSMMFSDPVSLVGQFASAFDIDVLEEGDGAVTLSLVPTEETAQLMAEQIPDGTLTDGQLTLDAESGAPRSMKIAVGGDFNVQLDFTNFEKLSASDIPEGTFVYEVPAGTQVMDLTPMLRSGGM